MWPQQLTLIQHILFPRFPFPIAGYWFPLYLTNVFLDIYFKDTNLYSSWDKIVQNCQISALRWRIQKNFVNMFPNLGE